VGRPFGEFCGIGMKTGDGRLGAGVVIGMETGVSELGAGGALDNAPDLGGFSPP
jgi:hypothetical protein